MTVLVTGGAGFIGSQVADALVEAGREVVVFDDLSSGRRENVPEAAIFVEADLRDRGAVEAVFEAHEIEAVCHQAAQTSVSVSVREPIRDAEVNLMGSLHLLEACRVHGVSRFVFASTGGAICGDIPEGLRADEGWTPNPISPYACSKLGFEGYLAAYRHEFGLASTVLRYSNVYGPRQDPHGEAGVVAIFCERLAAGEGVQINAMHELGDGGCVRDYVFVGDVVRINLLAMEGAFEADVLNVATGIGTTTQELVEALEAAFDVSVPKVDGPRRAGDIARSILEPNAEVVARVAPMGVEAGLQETARWFEARARRQNSPNPS